MSITPDNFLNVIGILINEVVGDVVFFIFLGAIIITYICVTNGINIKTTAMLNAIFALLILTLYYDVFIIGIIIFVVGLLIVAGYQYWLRQQNN